MRLTTLLSFLLLGSTAQATTYTVKADGTGDFPTIQAAIDAAVNGDVIELEDGTYIPQAGQLPVDFSGKDVTVRSVSGNPKACVLDGLGSFGYIGPGVSFSGGETSAAVLEGVGIRDINTGPVDASFGAALQLNNGASPTIRDVEVTGITPGGGFRHAVEVLNGSPTFENCEISGATGGGMLLSSATVTLTGCVISANSLLGSAGAGVLAFGTNLTLQSCRIDRNVTTAFTQGPFLGGGIYAWGGTLDLDDCLVVENVADDQGGGIFLDNGATASIDGCTIAANRSLVGGGIYAFGGSGTMDRSILWGNCATSGPDAALIANTWTATCTDVDPALVSGTGTLVLGTGSVTVAPLFCQPRFCTDPTSVAGLYSLQLASPVLDLPGCGMLGATLPSCTISIAPRSWGAVKGGYRSEP